MNKQQTADTKVGAGYAPTSITELLCNLCFPFCSTGLLSTYIGRLPLLVRRNSPLFRSFIDPWRLEILNAGPSSARSTSTWWSLADLPILICHKTITTNLHASQVYMYVISTLYMTSIHVVVDIIHV